MSLQLQPEGLLRQREHPKALTTFAFLVQHHWGSYLTLVTLHPLLRERSILECDTVLVQQVPRVQPACRFNTHSPTASNCTPLSRFDVSEVYDGKLGR